MNMIKHIFRLSKVFQKPWNSFRILSSVSLKYCSMRKKKILSVHKACIIKRPREIWKTLDRFMIQEKWHSYVIWMFTNFRECCLLSEMYMALHCSFMHTFEENNFLSLRTQMQMQISVNMAVVNNCFDLLMEQLLVFVDLF